MKSKKIAVFLPNLYGGGAERSMVNLCRGMADRNADVDLVLVRKEGAYVPLVPPSVRIVDLKAGHRPISGISRLMRYLHRERPEVLLCVFPNVYMAALIARIFARVPTRLFVSEQNHTSIKRRSHTRLILRLVNRLQPRIYRSASGIIAVSRGVAEDLIQNVGISDQNLHVVNNAIVTPELRIRAIEPPEHPWFLTGEVPVILGVGRLGPQKDFRNLIHAFSIVRRQRLAKLVILGEGAERSTLLALRDTLGLANEIDMPGFVENPYAFMSRASIFVLSSRFEGSPTVLVEAMACGTPVVATNCPSGPEETLEGGRFGELVPVGDPQALANAITRTLDSQVDVTAIKRRALEFSIDNSAKQYMRILLGTDTV